MGYFVQYVSGTGILEPLSPLCLAEFHFFVGTDPSWVCMCSVCCARTVHAMSMSIGYYSCLLGPTEELMIVNSIDLFKDMQCVSSGFIMITLGSFTF